MKKQFAILSGFLVLGLLDGVLSMSYPIDHQFTHVSIIWHLYFIGLLVFVHDKPLLTRILIAVLAGLVSDLFLNNTFPFACWVYPIFASLCGVPLKYMNRSKPAFAVYFLCCFFLDFLPFLWQKWQGTLQVSFLKWLVCMEAGTSLTNAACILIIMYLDMIMVRFFLIQKHLDQKKAKKKMRKASAMTFNSSLHSR